MIFVKSNIVLKGLIYRDRNLPSCGSLATCAVLKPEAWSSAGSPTCAWGRRLGAIVYCFSRRISREWVRTVGLEQLGLEPAPRCDASAYLTSAYTFNSILSLDFSQQIIDFPLCF